MEYRFVIKDMLCARCEQSIIDAVRRIDREAVVEVDRPNDKVTVNSIEPRDAIIIAITEEGYTVSP
jgi:copper chaperone